MEEQALSNGGMGMIIIDVGLVAHNIERGDQRDRWTDTEYYIKINDGGTEWYVNKDKSYTLDEALKKRDEMLDGVQGRRG